MNELSQEELTERFYGVKSHRDKLLFAAKKAMHCLTSEEEKEWMRSQANEEAPYHFLWVAICNVSIDIVC